MKKLLFVLIFLVGCSAFAFSPNYCGTGHTMQAKAETQTLKPSPTPIADMVMFPHIGG